MKSPIRTVLLLHILLFPVKTFSQDTWDLVKEHDGITVYTKSMLGSEYKSFKASALIHASVHDVLRVIRDVSNYTSWFAYAQSAKSLDLPSDLSTKKNPENSGQSDRFFVYMETQTPWPFKNEDMIYAIVINAADSSEIVVSLIGHPDALPEHDGINRMKKAEGSFRFIKVENGIRVTYQMHSELGGGIPIWLANNSIYELPYRTLSNLRRILGDSSTLRSTH